MTPQIDKKLRDALRARLPTTIGELRARVAEHAPDALSAREGYTITNAAGDDGDTAVVRIYDEIWFLGVKAEDLVEDLDAITAPKIRVEINSPGGDVFDGIAIYHALRNHRAEVTTRIDGIAASIASVIFQAGDHRVMQPASQMMIHNAWGLAIGDASDHADMAQILEQQDTVIAGIYAAHSDHDVDHFRDLMAAETWMTAERALDEGLADEIIEPGTDPTPTQTGNRARTLNQQISETVAVLAAAVSRAEAVRAVRSEAGKDLSLRNLEGLHGLRDAAARLDALLTPPTNQVDIDAEFARYVGHMQGVPLS